MKRVSIHLCLVVLLVSSSQLLRAFKIPELIVVSKEAQLISKPESDLKKEASQILKSKCNVCHKKKNPFKVFSLKNMDRHASEIHKQVFVYRRMPKGNRVKLTDKEYQSLKKWLKSKNIY